MLPHHHDLPMKNPVMDIDIFYDQSIPQTNYERGYVFFGIYYNTNRMIIEWIYYNDNLIQPNTRSTTPKLKLIQLGGVDMN